MVRRCAVVCMMSVGTMVSASMMKRRCCMSSCVMEVAASIVSLRMPSAMTEAEPKHG